MKIGICIPSSGMMHSATTRSILNMILAYPEITFKPYIVISSSVHINREECVTQALADGNDYILFIDDDMVFEPKILGIMLNRHKTIVGANYVKRKLPVEFLAVKPDQSATIITSEASTGLEECLYTGFGFCLIHNSVFRKLEHPWFEPKWMPEFGTYSTEDYPFFLKARKPREFVEDRNDGDEGDIGYVDHDASKLIRHEGQYEYRWNDYKHVDLNAIRQTINVDKMLQEYDEIHGAVK